MQWVQPDCKEVEISQNGALNLNAVFGHYTEQNVKVIFRSGFIRLAVSAFETFMNDDPLTFAEFHRDRFHQSAAIRCPISRADIDML